MKGWHEALASAPARLQTGKDAPTRRTRAPAASAEQKRARRSTANRILTVLKAALNRAWHAGHAATDDSWRTVRPFRRADGLRVRYLQRDEIERLLNACGPDFRRLARRPSDGGRYGELCRVKVGDFDPDTGMLHIRETKSDRPRHVPLDDDALAFLRAATAGRQRGELLFLRTNGEPWKESHQKRPIARASAAARLDPPATFHSLRHTWASHRVMAGAPLMSPGLQIIERYGYKTPAHVRADQIGRMPMAA